MLWHLVCIMMMFFEKIGFTEIEWKFSKCRIDRIDKIDRIERIEVIDLFNPVDPIDLTLRKIPLDPLDPLDPTLKKNLIEVINRPRI